jgi:triosephosphate isomerase (TIM)
MKPFILINFKNYKEALGSRSLPLAKAISKVPRNKYQIAIAPSLLNFKEIAKKVSIPVFAQHADPVTSGAATGSVSIEELQQFNAAGIILNHSEHKIPLDLLKKTIKMCKTRKLVTVVCASTLAEAKKIAHFKPNYIAYEPQELIGGKISVTSAKPDIILKVVQAVKGSKVLCGAGVHSGEDLGQALLLGADGVLIGHSVPQAKDPKKYLQKMLI